MDVLTFNEGDKVQMTLYVVSFNGVSPRSVSGWRVTVSC